MEIRTNSTRVRGPYRTYDAQDLTDAFQAVVDDGLPVERAAKRYCVPITTLKDRVRGRISTDTVKSGPSPLFSQEDEAILSRFLLTMSEVGYGYSRQETINIASDYAIHLGLRDKQHPLSLQWFYDFLSRWPELKLVKPRSLEIARARCATESAISNYFKELNSILTKYNLKDKPHMLYNVDEKGLNPEHKPTRIVAGKTYKAQAVTSGKGKTVTVLGCANAVGQQVPPYFVFPGKRMLDPLLQGASAGADGDVSESGWSNKEIFSKYMKEHLFKYLPSRDDGSYALVLYDGHKSHVTIPLIEWAIQNHIILFVLPPHCSHLLQPLDVSCYGPFELAWNSACHKFIREKGGCAITRYDVCEIACYVYSATLSVANIQASFKKSGIYPYNPDVISTSAVAPSTSFEKATETNIQNNQEPESTDDSHRLAAEFLEKKGGQILKNVKQAKVRKTLSKVVGGKAITEPSVVEAIRSHIESQTSSKKSVESSSKKVKYQTKPVTPGPSGLQSKAQKRKQVPEDSQSSDSESSDIEESEKCIICKCFTPKDLHKKPFIYIVKWGKCDRCWVHLTFCTTIRVLRRGDSFLCPNCQNEYTN